jgi:RecA-family ATPase
MPLERWLDFLSSTAGIFDEPQGAWIRVNPFIPERYDGKNEDVSVFRHLLVESDKLPKSQQWEIYQQSGLPITAVIDSAGSSLHAWVRIDAENAEQYKERAERVYETLVPLGFDAGNKNPSRFSRLPGAVRNGRPQQLVTTNIGANDWEEWEEENDDDGFRSDIENRLDLKPEVDLIKQPEIIHGVLRQMDKLVLGASSKAGKTWALMDLFVSVTSGREWLGILTNECRALYLNFELHAPSFKQRILDIEKAKGLTRPSGLMDWWNLRDEGASIDTVIPRIIRKAKRKNYSMIILDPTYEMLGDRDENKASDMNDLMNYLGKLSVATNAAIVFAAHFSKGPQESKEAIHRISGSGVFARKPDCIVTMTEHEVDKAFTVDFKLRDYPRRPSFVIQWGETIFRRVDSLNPQKLRRSGNRGPVYSVDLLLESLGNDELTPSEWRERCEEKHGMSPNTFQRLRKELILKQRVYKSNLDGKYSKTSRELEKSDS